MDCVRTSLREIKDREWDAFYYTDQGGSTTENWCRQNCVSKRNCKAWKYKGDNKSCSLTFALRGYYPNTVKSPGTVSGLVQCKKEAWSMLKLVLYFLLFIVVFAIFAWIVSRCPKK